MSRSASSRIDWPPDSHFWVTAALFIVAQTAMDGLYVIRTSVTAERMQSGEVLMMYKFDHLLEEMAALTRNSICFECIASEFHQLIESPPLQRRDLELLSTHAYPDTAFPFQGFMTTLHCETLGSAADLWFNAGSNSFTECWTHARSAISIVADTRMIVRRCIIR